MSYLDELKAKEQQVTSSIEEEEIKTMLESVTRPDGAKEALKFQYEELDTLTLKTLEKYLGALSQYLIYVTKYINILSSKKKIANSFYTRKLNEIIYKNSATFKTYKSMAEKELNAQQMDLELLTIVDHIDGIDAKLALYNSIPDTIENLINAIKKVYDARRQERQSVEQ